jgi:Predicted membrane protein (DUF2157)
MHQQILQSLLEKNILQPDEADRITAFENNRPFSVHWELKSMLYFGVLLINVGLGVLIYEHIDTVGHLALILAIGAVSMACFGYVYLHRLPFTTGEVESPTPYYDYVLLLGCLTFLIMEGYWQYQYQIFGERYGLAMMIPAVLFFGLAYYFDHRGVLALAITAFAAWLGITITPYTLLSQNDFNSERIVLTGIGLGIFLSAVPFLSEKWDIKKHFSLTYLNFGIHIFMVSCLAGIISAEREMVYFPVLCLAAAFYLWYARLANSFYFLVVTTIYGYIGLTSLIFNHSDGWDFEGYLLYLVLTCGGIIFFLLRYKKFFPS